MCRLTLQRFDSSPPAWQQNTSHSGRVRTSTASRTCKDAAQAIEFYKKEFGAAELHRIPMPGGKVGHAEIKIAGAIILLSDEFPECGVQSPATLGGTPRHDLRAGRGHFRRTRGGCWREGARAGKGSISRRPLLQAARPVGPQMVFFHARRGWATG